MSTPFFTKYGLSKTFNQHNFSASKKMVIEIYQKNNAAIDTSYWFSIIFSAEKKYNQKKEVLKRIEILADQLQPYYEYIESKHINFLYEIMINSSEYKKLMHEYKADSQLAKLEREFKTNINLLISDLEKLDLHMFTKNYQDLAKIMNDYKLAKFMFALKGGWSPSKIEVLRIIEMSYTDSINKAKNNIADSIADLYVHLNI